MNLGEYHGDRIRAFSDRSYRVFALRFSRHNVINYFIISILRSKPLIFDANVDIRSRPSGQFPTVDFLRDGEIEDRYACTGQ